MASCTVKLARRPDKTPGPRPLDIHLVGVQSANATVELPPIVHVAVTRADGSTIDSGQIGWYGPGGGLIGRGRSLALSVLPVGVRVVRAAVLNTGEGEGIASWLFERTADGRYFWHRGTVTYPDPDCPPRITSASVDHRRVE
jgi:hypothetical protein